MTATVITERFEDLYPTLHAQVRSKLELQGHDPADFIVTSAHDFGDRIEASYYPRLIADQHKAGNYAVPNYHWVALDAVKSQYGFAHLHVCLLEDGGWIG